MRMSTRPLPLLLLLLVTAISSLHVPSAAAGSDGLETRNGVVRLAGTACHALQAPP